MILPPRLRPLLLALIAASLAFLPAAAFAAGSNMPWEQPLQQILESVQGPVAMPFATA